MSENQNLTKKRWSVLIVSCIINVMIGTGYAWSMFVGPLNEHFVAMGFDTAMATLTWAFTLANSIGPIPMIIGGYINDNIGPCLLYTSHPPDETGRSAHHLCGPWK